MLLFFPFCFLRSLTGTESFEGVHCRCKVTGWIKKSKVIFLSVEQIKPGQRWAKANASHLVPLSMPKGCLRPWLHKESLLHAGWRGAHLRMPGYKQSPTFVLCLTGSWWCHLYRNQLKNEKSNRWYLLNTWEFVSQYWSGWAGILFYFLQE